MTDEAKLRQQHDRGERAKRVMENELVQEAFDKIESEIDEAWKNSRADDDAGRYNAYLMYRLLQNFKQQFKSIMITGEGARKELLNIKDPSKIRQMFSA